ncbi:MAG: hypothetical protein AB1626_04920, partial [Candidatus Micrarchaeota archaeon]
FLRTFGLTGSEVAQPIKAAHDAKRASLFSLSDLISELNSMRESKDVLMFNIRRAVRTLQVLQKIYPSLFAKNISADLATPWRDAIGKVFFLNVKKYPVEIQRMLVSTIIESIPVPPTTSLSLIIAFEHDADQIIGEAELVLKKYKKQGVGLLVHAQHEVDVQKLGEFTATFEVVNGEAIGAETGERQTRFTPRPAYSSCTETVAPAPQAPAAPPASALQALQQKPPAPAPAQPVQPVPQPKKSFLGIALAPKKPVEKKEEPKKPEAPAPAEKKAAEAPSEEVPFALEKI